MRTSPTETVKGAIRPAFSRVLVPLDGTAGAERALAPATVLALGAGASVWPMSAAPGSEALDRLGYLTKVAARLDVPYVQPEVLDHDGAADAIESIACSYNRLQGGLVVCMSTHARAAIPEVVLGSTAAEVVRTGAAPVVLVGPHVSEPWSLRNLVVCLDGSDVAEAIIPMASAWAASMGLGCWLVQVVEPEARWACDTTESGYLRNTALMLRAQGVQADWEVLHGADVVESIAQFVATVPGAMVAMTTHGRSGRALVTMGSTATAVVRHTQTPVLVYRS